MKNKVAFEPEVYVCISDKLMQQDAETQYYFYLFGGLFNDGYSVETMWLWMVGWLMNWRGFVRSGRCLTEVVTEQLPAGTK
jgi:hypothetical protein